MKWNIYKCGSCYFTFTNRGYTGATNSLFKLLEDIRSWGNMLPVYTDPWDGPLKLFHTFTEKEIQRMPGRASEIRIYIECKYPKLLK